LGEKKSATRRLLEQFPYCCPCGGGVKAETREYVPPRALFDRSHRPDHLVVPACARCNSGTRTSDQVTAIIARWGFTAPTTAERIDHGRLSKGIASQAPELIVEWRKNAGAVSQRQARRHLASYGVPIPDGAKLLTIGPKTLPYLNQFAHKLTLGLYFEKTNNCFPNTGLFRAFLRFKENFKGEGLEGLPQEITRILGTSRTLVQGSWDTGEQFEYRSNYNPDNGLFMHASRLRSGLFVAGIASEHPELLPRDMQADSISPADLLGILHDPRYQDKM
jgi:hypothetical protein